MNKCAKCGKKTDSLAQRINVKTGKKDGICSDCLVGSMLNG